MANFLVQENKQVKCGCCGSMCTVSFQTTIHKCSHCDKITCVSFFGSVPDKYGGHIIGNTSQEIQKD